MGILGKKITNKQKKQTNDPSSLSFSHIVRQDNAIAYALA